MEGILRGTYVKDALETRIDIFFSGSEADEYKEKMLFYNNTERIISPVTRIEGGEEFTSFTVTGKKPMELLFRTHTMREKRIVSIIDGILEAFDEAKELLLVSDDFVLLPEYIYMDISDYSVSLLYLPGYAHSIKKQLECLFEYMLNRVDYNDKCAVELLYDCYVIVMKEEKGVISLRERIRRDEDDSINDKSGQMNGAGDLCCVTEARPGAKKTERSLTESKKKEKKGFLARLFGGVKEEDYDGQSYSETVDFTVPNVENLIEEDNNTILLSSVIKEYKPVLIDKNNGNETIIEKVPFFIGTLHNHTDFTLKDVSVSRLHAEINEKEGRYSVSDLNSTNGTFVNEKEVIPGRPVELCSGDVIRIADLSYIYKEGERSREHRCNTNTKMYSD